MKLLLSLSFERLVCEIPWSVDQQLLYGWSPPWRTSRLSTSRKCCHASSSWFAGCRADRAEHLQIIISKNKNSHYLILIAGPATEQLAHPRVVEELRWWVRILSQRRVIIKDVKNDSYCCYVRCAPLIFRIGGLPWPKTGGATYYHAKLGLRYKGRAVIELFVCCVLLNSIPRMFGKMDYP